MTIFQSIILGAIQGIAEFLPISSSGHLIIMQSLFKIKEPTIFFDVILHVGTLIPILFIYRKIILNLLKNPFQKMTFLLILGTIPAVLITLFFGDKIDLFFEKGKYLPICFFTTGLLLLIADNGVIEKKKSPSCIDAIFIGIMQCIGILPGISRSGSTICGAIFCKVDKEEAGNFSFLLAIPAIMGALILQLKNFATGENIIGNINVLPTVIGFITALVSGYFSITFLLKMLKKANLKYFAYYVFLVGIFVLICQHFFHIKFEASII